MARRLTDGEKFQRTYSRRPARNEHCLQRSVIRWCRGVGAGYVRGRVFSIPNGSALRGGAIAWKRLADTGATPGVADLCFLRRDGRVLFAEMKNGTSGVLSPAQIAWARLCEENRIQYSVCRTLAEAVTTVIAFYSGEGNP
jgi:hypothetical protein